MGTNQQAPDESVTELNRGTNTGALSDLSTMLGDIHSDVEDLSASLSYQRNAQVDRPDTCKLSAKLDILRIALTRQDHAITAELNPTSPTGHGYAVTDQLLKVSAGESRPILEELAELGLLRRELQNRIHVCSQCNCCQINFRETCPACNSIELGIERLLHHFSCAYIGLEREFVDGVDLRCPKCRDRLHQLGQDFERPHETYVCGSCPELSEEPLVSCQCLNCTTIFPATGARVLDIYRYFATELTARAIELGRLTALKVADLLFDPEARLARLDYLVLEARREFIRLRRHDGSLSFALLRFHVDGEPSPILRDATVGELKDLGCKLTSSLRELDLAAPVDAATLGVLFPETTNEVAQTITRRMEDVLDSMELLNHAGDQIQVAWKFHTWNQAPEDQESALTIIRGGA
jgi:hypothetical protein